MRWSMGGGCTLWCDAPGAESVYGPQIPRSSLLHFCPWCLEHLDTAGRGGGALGPQRIRIRAAKPPTRSAGPHFSLLTSRGAPHFFYLPLRTKASVQRSVHSLVIEKKIRPNGAVRWSVRG